MSEAGFIAAVFIALVAGGLLLMYIEGCFKRRRTCLTGKPHAWGKWHLIAVTYQQRQCDVCGISETANS